MTEQLGPGDYLKAIGLGILFMIIALIVQEIVQEIPEFIYLGLNKFNLSLLISNFPAIEQRYPIEFAVYLGLVAAVMQEVATYIAVDTRVKALALFIGLGFSIVDIAILLIETVPVYSEMTTFALSLVALNTVSSLLFHPGTAMFMKWGRITGYGGLSLGVSIMMHTIIDGGLVFADFFIVAHPALYYQVSIEFWIVVMAISVGMFFLGINRISRVEDRNDSEPPVVY